MVFKGKRARGQAARRARETDEAPAAADDAAPMDDEAAREEQPVARLDDVESTEERLDVSGHGEISVVTTYLTGALIGHCVRINNSAWPGYSKGYTTCAPGPRPRPRVRPRKMSVPLAAAATVVAKGARAPAGGGSMHGATSMYGGSAAVNVDSGLTANVMAFKATMRTPEPEPSPAGGDDVGDDDWGD